MKHKQVKKKLKSKLKVTHKVTHKAHAPVSKQTDKEYLYERFYQLYQQSSHARWSLALIVLFGKYRQVIPADELAKRQAQAEAEFDDTEGKRHWLHKPYPYSGHLRIFVFLLGLSVISVIVQIMYPSGLTLPLSRLDSNGYAGFKTQAQISDRANLINHRQTVVSTKDSRLTATPLEMGVRANGEETFSKLSDYPIQKRVIPFSVVFMSIKPQKVSREINVEKLTTFTKGAVTVTSHESKDAKVSLQGTKLVISPSEDGYEYDQLSIQKQLALTPLGNEVIELTPRMIPAKLTTRMAEESITSMQKRIDAGLTISAADENLRFDSATVASWVSVSHKPDVQAITLSFDKGKVTESLRPLVGLVDKVDIPDQVTMLNGVEAGRKYGTAGQSLQFDDLVNQVVSASDWTVGLIQAKVLTVTPRQNFIRTYSKDSMGLQSLLDYWVKNNKGRFGVDLRSQNGRINASSNSFKVFNGAYKLYIPHLVYGEITSRKLNPGSMTSTGFTIDGCIDRVILSGHDNCTRALGDMIGWGDNNSLLSSQSMSDTTLTRSNGATTANDAGLWAMQLLNGSLTTIAQRNNMISLMSEQSARSGIPAGTRGTPVANTAGQSGSLRYDVGIIYNQRGTYVLSVFSEGSSFQAIADLASQVNQTMGQ